ncbi:leucyl/phenylalanyl-tRNA--protein transferase [Bordetella avium]|uniref:Leucyl/phenylalanyl-tRNA--protein transferase n=1 Tax=Bordetella avium (strain 197N) TaxID=360910 RepID=LFTR_BORA1|nr:leucyl/phenylalanyl-tRNA--protein transferase [Bordetella avium]Q2KW47.1 RecName: Full=Leucyl/phenylalanyl-tRNA--protein transferase; AltName: Full=L/F-transferase; AltName: Full=Leucyltransferase; AltName: Full=Phenyalanyltransferase [Bordetella avium 197N]AZY53523.1 leucyl/phenylalanyl-tRNA--protein transferase [Bordetella avium]RIQ11810.1 leucyl/phenylalanyl-tRNA--protein transferase [Bordetella avium]RIQ16284.1 leucyl/phenylalanyl-tRNA--protein transferase [Bordetella avium]RIQ33924.1 l
MRIPWLEADTPFPPAEQALKEPNGLLAAGGELNTDRLRAAYAKGIFPWYSEGEPLLWWSPDPRMVLACADFAPSHSLRKTLRRLARAEQAGDTRIQVRVDTAFARVMAACAGRRDGQAGTWITPEVQAAYCAWHEQGQAHSIETWIDDHLVGGLYGISLGGMFFGESMFAHATDASKIALAYLVAFLTRHEVDWIDCQQQTRHLASLGARPLPRAQFLQHVARVLAKPAPPWRVGVLRHAGDIVDSANQR